MSQWLCFKNSHKVIPQLIIALIGSLGYFCIGCIRAWTSVAYPGLNATSTEMNLTANDLKWISSVPMLGAITGSLLSSIPMQYFGRRRTLIVHYSIFAIGFSLIGLAFYTKEKILIYIGRIVTGFGAGFSTPVCQIYISECSSPGVRGRLSSLTASNLAFGILATYFIGATTNWHTLAFIIASLPVTFLCASFFLPESPSWLLKNGKEKDVRASLRFLRGKKTNIESEIERLKEHQNLEDSSRQQETGSFVRDFFRAPVIKPLIISLGLMLFQDFTGVNAVVFYTVNIFQAAGSTIDGYYATVIVGVVQLVFTCASGLFVDRFGRRVLIMVSSAFTAISLASMAIYFNFQRRWGDEEASAILGWLPLVSLMVFMVAYSCGMSNVPFIIMGEMFPLRFRTVLGAISSSFNLFCTFVVVRSYPDLLALLGKDGTFGLYTTCTILSILFVYFFLPETKGRTLEDIEKLFLDRTNDDSDDSDIENENSIIERDDSRAVLVSFSDVIVRHGLHNQSTLMQSANRNALREEDEIKYLATS